MVGAACWVTLDTVLWLVAVFVFSGPILLSGFYEAFLDRRLLTYVELKVNSSNLELDVRARILFAILAGNLC